MTKRYRLTVVIPEFDEKAAYNHDRPISSLVRTQLLHLHTAENLALPEKDRTDININHLLTERQASEYIQKVTALLHSHGKAARRKPTTEGRSKGRPKARKRAGRGYGAEATGPKTSKTKSSVKKSKSRK